MAEESPQNINPATDPQVEDPPSTAVPASQVDRAPAEVSSAQDPQVPPPYEENPQVTAFIEAVEADAEVRQQLAIQSLKDEAAESDLRGESRTFTESETQNDPYINRLQNQQDLAAITASQPDAAFQRAQQAKEERWQTAAAANPDGIRNDGSVNVDLGGGQRETINRDGSFAISGAEGTYRYNADGQLESYTTPSDRGSSRTYTTDGVVVDTYSTGPFRTETISYNGELVSTNLVIRTGDQTLGVVQVGDGPPVTSVSTVVPIEGTAGLQVTAAQVGDGEIVTSTLDLEQRRLDRLAADEARADAADQLRQDIRASQAQVESGIPLSATQLAAIEEQAQALEAADAALAQAEEALAEADPTIVPADTDPQVVAAIDQDPIPAFDTTEFAPADVTGDAEIDVFAAQQEAAEFVPVSDIDTGPVEVTQDEEIISFEEAQAQNDFVPESEIDTDPTEVTQDEQIISFEEAQAQNEFVPAADVDTAAADVDPADDPEVPQPVDDLPDAFVYDTADTIELADDPIILAQADATATDVRLVDIAGDPEVIGEEDPAAIEPIAPPEGGFYGEPTPVGGNFTAAYDPETGTYSVVDLDTGETVETGLSQQQATLAAEEFSVGDPQFPNETDALGAAADSDIIREPTDVDVAEAQFVETDTGFFELQEEAAPQPDEFGFVEADDGFFVTQEEIEAGIDQQQFEGETDPEEFVPLSEIEESPEPVLASDAAEYGADAEGEGEVIEFTADGPVTRDANQAISDAAIAQGAVANARNQQSIREQRGNNVDTADWRVRIRLAPQATYLYKDPACGILQPLAVSDGVIFPYMPSIQTVYKANYTPYNLTHSNYRGYFYQGSSVEDINITGIFTAQDSVEAAYLLAVIHFFRSVTKMFYGQDPQRGAPPPLVYLSALGASQYVDAPCVVGQFNYNLPTDVDYIRAGAPNQDGTNLLKRRDRQYLPTNRFSYAQERIRAAGLPRGGEVFPPPPPTLGLSRPTYVPTRMEISLILHPMQSRQQVSQQFSVKEYGPGRLQEKGFW